MSIKILPEEIASAIAAGEVIERPASVVKELVENSLDAGASEIEIVVEQGGKSLIEVSDNGDGIAPDEIELALARHATSKLERAEDLFSIQSLGFRGEALSSIAAVSRFELISRQSEFDSGRRLRAEGGVKASVEKVGAPVGTLVRVRELFFNVPARRKFLKTDPTERRWINEYVTRYALAYPQTRFRLIHDGQVSFQSTGNGDRREVLAEMFGLERAQQRIRIPGEEGADVRVSGYVSPPAIHRSNRKEMTFFVNGRWVQDASLSAAVMQAYHGLLMVGRYPMAVIFLEMAPKEVDVNVHPAKAEVRFEKPREIFSSVQRSVRATLLRETKPPQVDLNRGWQREIVSGDREEGMDPDWWSRAQEMRGQATEAPRLIPAEGLSGEVPLLRLVGQVGTAYLVAEGPDGLYLIDQHAAHERILFERLMAAHRSGQIESQSLLEAVTVELTPQETPILEERLESLGSLGFEVEPFGRTSYRVRAMPAMLGYLSPEKALRTVVEDFEADETPLAGEIEAIVAARVCKRAAIKAGQVLSLEEQRQLLRDLEACTSPRTCPHGRPTMIHLSVAALERQFGRRG
ncbi:MAG: DNA mismatch repair endonuclease MutL [Anaerolineales bacterium]